MDSDLEILSIEGTISRIVYTNSENGYTVLELITEDGDVFTVVGIIPFVCEGETIKVTGSWVSHPTFGKQFKAEYFEKEMPTTEAAILRYLASGIIKGIGPITAKRIVETYRLDTFDVIEHNPEWLASIPGISKKKALDIAETFREQVGMREVFMFCREFFGPSISAQIYKEFGTEAVETIKNNPYILCGRIEGIGFDKADAVARTLGIRKNSRDRIAAGVKYVLDYNAFESGHVYIPLHKLVPTSDLLLGCGEEDILQVISEEVNGGLFVSAEIYGKTVIYTKERYDAERYIYDKLKVLEKRVHCVDNPNLEAVIRMNEADNGITYDAMQYKAIKSAAVNSVFILTGGPGTGKTTVVKAIINVFYDMGLSVSLCAPTGRAAKRMSAAAGREAKTIHRLLEMQYDPSGELKFQRNENNRLDCDVVIMDEASMVDLDVMSALLKAMKNSARLILIGDENQLPPVGAGCVFKDMLESDVFTTVKLDHIFRQAEESYIVVNAHTINRGEYLELDKKDSDFFFLRRPNDTETANTIVELCRSRLPKKYKTTVFDGIQVISSSRKGEPGTENLNNAIQAAVNPPVPGRPEKKFGPCVFRIGDKVMQTKNNYDILWTKFGVEGNGIFNGDLGVIKDIDLKNERVIIDFEDKICEYDFSMLGEIELGYAITVHKSQGSEYPIVIMPLYRCAPQLLTRNLLYTAVTRAQAMMILVGDENVSKAMIDNDRKDIRYTGLKFLLENQI